MHLGPTLVDSRIPARTAVALMLALIIATGGCGLTGPGDPERSIVGTYRGQWTFGIYDSDTIARGDDPPGAKSHGWIHCPGELQVTEQDDKDIRGRFELRPRNAFSTCVSQEAGFCTEAIVAKFCRQVSGTFKGEAFSTGSPEARTILFDFRMTVAQSEGRAALERFAGCTVIAEEKDRFTGGVRDDMNADASVQATVQCGGEAGLERVDLTIRIAGDRVLPGH